MRILSTTLEAAQKSAALKPLVKVAVAGQTFSQTRILSLTHMEQESNQNATIVLDNTDRALSLIDLHGQEAVISYGARTGAGDEYSACAPLYVMSQQLNSSQGRLACILSLAGIPNMLAVDKASNAHTCPRDSPDTLKGLISAVLYAGMDVFTHCKAYTVDYDSEDSLLDSLLLKDGFYIAFNESRLAVIKRLLGYTRCCFRAGDDGHLQIFNPGISGPDYDYEYRLGRGNHTFFNKTIRHKLIIPNYVTVKSRPADQPQYANSAAHSDHQILEVRSAVRVPLEDNNQALSIAEAILQHLMVDGEQGSALVPLNCGAEVWDYVRVMDARENDSRSGNIQQIVRRWNAGGGLFTMQFSFGKPPAMSVNLGTSIPIDADHTGGSDPTAPSLAQIWHAISLLQEEIANLKQLVDPIPAGEGRPLENFVDLKDVPQSYLDAAGKVPLVNETEDGLVFGEFPALDLDLIPAEDDTYDIGSCEKRWSQGYVNHLYVPHELVIPVESA